MSIPHFTEKFADNLAQLPSADHLSALELTNVSGGLIGRIENKPGQAGSLRVYAWLAEQFGAITPEAATLALRIYAEHTTDAKAHPGKHPNIDRLLDAHQTLQVKLFPAVNL